MADHEVVVGRLHKRIEKLQQQRDYYRQRCEHYAEVLRMHPFIEHQASTWTKQREERERVRGLEQRAKEQSLLIDRLIAAAKEPKP